MSFPPLSVRSLGESLKSIISIALLYLDPRYHIDQMREDLRATLHALRCKNLKNLDRVEFAKALRGRLFACFFVAGPFSFTGVVASVWLQARSHNLWVGMISMYIINIAVSTLAYQVAWGVSSREFYSEKRSPWRLATNVLADIWPVQWKGLVWAFTFSMISIPFNSVLIVVIYAFLPKTAESVPMGLVVAVFDFVFVSGTFVRVMGDIFEKYSVILADRYWQPREPTQADSEPSPPHPDGHLPVPAPASIPAA